eukprot:CAMPEP_0172611516 /NCGR_PEP_ID=MMETSP1068-20121228/31183_1 /TAXON_ID=35684 /ORGANISM="Pseudopedinella elastica, Strain CCMP716" /LENGTH=379 /DNA_ID=CAMNT_0013415511 /DNA_START=644 /DNA_END=1780 /DNA_ORIENTATION=-
MIAKSRRAAPASQQQEAPSFSTHKRQPTAHRRRCTRRCILLGISSVGIVYGAALNLQVLDFKTGDSFEVGYPPMAVAFDHSSTIDPDTESQHAVPSVPTLASFVAPTVYAGGRYAVSALPALHRPTPRPEGSPAQSGDPGRRVCANTGQGPRLVTDSQGYTCALESVGSGPSRGCCPPRQRSLLSLASPYGNAASTGIEPGPGSGEVKALEPSGVGRYSCESCDPKSRCCSVFEFCVACCMGDGEARRDLLGRSKHSALLELAGSPFGLCAYKCRTSSGSVVHENSYRNPQKHCFGLTRPPLLPGVSVNSDASLARELRTRESAMSETEEERLDPFVLNAKLAAASSHRQRIAAANARRPEPSSANPPASLGSAGGLRG